MRLKLMEYNVQDLFLRLAYPVEAADLAPLSEAQWALLAADDQPLKPLAKLRGLARAITAEAPDVVMLCEVGGEESLANFTRLFLGDTYAPHLTRGNDDRGIDCGFLVRKGLPLTAELRSHKDRPVPFLYPHEEDPVANHVAALMAQGYALGAPAERKLSRDVAELRLFSGAAAQPCLVLLLAHLKSAFDREGFDRLGAVRRAAEARALLAVRAEVASELGAAVPIIVAGDLNASAQRAAPSPELAAVYAETDLEDVLELAGREPWERITHLTFWDGQVISRQLDYILVPKALHAAVDPALAYVHRYRFDEGPDEIQLPLSMGDRRGLPSDHYPVVCSLTLPVC